MVLLDKRPLLERKPNYFKQLLRAIIFRSCLSNPWVNFYIFPGLKKSSNLYGCVPINMYYLNEKENKFKWLYPEKFRDTKRFPQGGRILNFLPSLCLLYREERNFHSVFSGITYALPLPLYMYGSVFRMNESERY